MTKINNGNEPARKRAKNYTTEEEIVLVDMVESHKSVLQNKKSDAVIWKQKEEAWKKIAEEFEATMGIHRHWKALRDKYVMLRKKLRSEMAEQKSETYRTRATVSTGKVGELSAKVASMLDDSATGPQSCFDSDHLFENEEQDHCKMTSIKREENSSPEGTVDWSEPKSNEIFFHAKRKRSIEDERMELVLLQQKFYRDENIRAQEKHEQEMIALKLKNEILHLELAEKKTKS